MASGKRSSAGERVLEGRHVIGLFFLMLLFSGVFFTLGYVMGRNQLEDQVRAASPRGAEAELPLKAEKPAKAGKNNNAVVAPAPADNSETSTDPNTTAPSSDWQFYKAGEKSASNVNERLKPAAPASTATTAPTGSASGSTAKTVPASAKATSAPAGKSAGVVASAPKGSYYLQVAAVRSEGDALSLANELHKKKFPAFVQTPQGDKYYRVQVGPYTDQKAMQNAKKGLETAGFKAIIKH
jgi:septal ring-binding cell division protein DamX